MGENSKIEWTEHTFNPWIGCEKVSPGCDHCYAERGSARLGARYKLRLWDGDRYGTGPAYWKEPLSWNRAAERRGRPALVFCASYADVFDATSGLGLDDLRARLWALIEATPHLRWLLLTKRPGNILSLTPRRWWSRSIPSNIWLGTTAENQEYADKRIPLLLGAKRELGARIAFVSHEPALGPIDLRRWFACSDPQCGGGVHRGLTPESTFGAKDGEYRKYPCPERLDWVITGGESGPGARPYDIAWARDILDVARPEGVPCFVKQLGSNVRFVPVPGIGHRIDSELRFAEHVRIDPIPFGAIGGPMYVIHLSDRKGGDPSEWPQDLRVRETPPLHAVV